MKRALFLTVLVLSGMLLVGCGRDREVLEKLSQSESVEAVVLLNRSGVEAEQVRSATERGAYAYAVRVPSRDYTRALAALHQYGLPRERQEGVEELTRQRGFVPELPEINLLRLDRARGAEIERLLAGFPGVLDARVIVHTGAGKNGVGQTAAASVIVRYANEGEKTPFTVEDVKRVVVEAVPGVDAERISVTLTRVEPLAKGGGAGEGKAVHLGGFSFETPQQLVVVGLAIFVSALILGVFLGSVYGARMLSDAREQTKR